MSDRPTPLCDAVVRDSDGFLETARNMEKLGRRLERQRDAAVEALKAARKTLSYCAVNPRELHPANNSQHIVASNALGDLDAVLREIEEGKS